MILAAGKFRWVIILAMSLSAIAIVVVSVTFTILFISYVSDEERVAEPKAATIQNDMEREFQRISPLPLAMSGWHGSTHKTRQGVVSAEYKTERSYEAIKAYYDNELARLGWRFARETNVRYAGEDYGGKELFYCKGNYTGTLQYGSRQEEEFGWTYSFALSWGLSRECR